METKMLISLGSFIIKLSTDNNLLNQKQIDVLNTQEDSALIRLTKDGIKKRIKTFYSNLFKRLDELNSIIQEKDLEILRLQERINLLVSVKQEEYPEIFSKNIFDLNLSSRIQYAINNADCKTVGDIIKLGSYNLLKLRNFGEGSLQELQREFKKLGVTLE